MPFRTLIDTAALAQHLGDPQFAIVDCRFALEDGGAGERAYRAAHIPGAVYAHLARDLSGAVTGQNGRHPLPSSEQFARTLSQFGVDREVQVVAYGQQSDMFPTRLWWMLRWLGHDAVAVLDGGFDRWIAEGRPVRSGEETRAGRKFVPALRPEMIADVGEVARRAGRKDYVLLDARAPERYRGDIEPIDTAAGHIPGAANFHYKENLDAAGAFLDTNALQRGVAAAAGAVSGDHIICYCGSGVSACHNLLALERAGVKGAKLYPGSWSEWSSDPSRAVEKG
jgi:thiosulfate/3-mercaptopyruvate sulfurtransferase